jgi:hypothetical protein
LGDTSSALGSWLDESIRVRPYTTHHDGYPWFGARDDVAPLIRTKVSMFNPWFSLALKTIQLGYEAQSVITLRMMRFAAGGATAQTEARRMIADKVAAGIERRS